MNCWEMLGLEPTSNKKEIKKAYAVKLKKINIDEEPLAFQKLKEAYDSATFLSGTIIESNRPKESSLVLDKVEQERDQDDLPDKMKQALTEQEKEALTKNQNEPQESYFEHKQEIDNRPIDVLTRFNQDLQSLYERMDFFSAIDNWAPLFSNELDWSIDEHNNISKVMQHFLLVNYRVLSREVIDYLGGLFDFDSMAKDYNSAEYFASKWSDIKNVPLFSFDMYQSLPKEERVPYFTSRYELAEIINKAVLNSALWEEHLALCQKETIKDRDVIILQMAYLLLHDFRLENKQTIKSFQTLLGEAQSLKNDLNTAFFSKYYEWAKHNGAANDVLYYNKSELMIPQTAVELLRGYVYFKLKKYPQVNECWEGIWKKNPSMFRPNEVAAFQVEKPFNVPQKKQKSSWNYMWFVFIVIIGLVKLGSSYSRLNEHSSYTTTPDFTTLLSGENDSQDNYFSNELSELKESENLYDQFVYYFYVDREDEERETFIETKLVGHAKEMAQNMSLENLPEVTIDSRYAFHSSPDTVSEYGYVTALTLLEEDEPFIILQEDKDDKISNIYGEGWEVLPKEKFDALWTDIQVRPLMSQKFFVVYYLLSDERKENIKDNPEYVTENVKKLLEKNSDEPIANEFEAGTWQISQDEEDKLYTVVNDKEGEHRFILSYDRYGRLEHIYGDKWEKIEETRKQTIYDNAEEKIGMF
ncbi:hypothetical protein UAY_01984 [Enterococcus moraviensis ATCC BAA-383]|uniref:J domain-containing protein n=1 Tax=Enterococcus moraviensis ATCC BAA-383 TaxID=1158609 RepID=R2QRP9_9ENTE|nr:J domain-containing protein [Enterococcus moraviensis]EOH99207.1 hypothetical protein UAY_01984 [Enterococcus moraviensis ATCC BAA-383]EOT72110.1 hypothetical protein I586_01918 [Enterococcus moraviensis ATCC BAA-383]OJG67458.1 hypothetical protein RV09_GL002674 [Enterococcus moraviensis]